MRRYQRAEINPRRGGCFRIRGVYNRVVMGGRVLVGAASEGVHGNAFLPLAPRWCVKGLRTINARVHLPWRVPLSQPSDCGDAAAAGWWIVRHIPLCLTIHHLRKRVRRVTGEHRGVRPACHIRGAWKWNPRVNLRRAVRYVRPMRPANNSKKRLPSAAVPSTIAADNSKWRAALLHCASFGPGKRPERRAILPQGEPVTAWDRITARSRVRRCLASLGRPRLDRGWRVR